MNAANPPSIWQSFQIENLCESVKTINPRSKGKGFFKYVDISAIDNKNKVIVAAREIQNHEAPSWARQVVKTNDVLVSTVRPGLNAVAIVPEELDEQICSTAFCVLRAKPELLDPKFLFFWVQHPNFIDMLIRMQRGISYPALRDRDVRELSIFLPTLSEQKQIAAILQEANELLNLRQQANEKAKQFLPSLFQETFGDLRASSSEWEIVSVEKAGKVQLGRQRAPKYQTGRYTHPYLRVANVFEDRIDISDVLSMDFNEREFPKYKLEYGDILLNEGQVTELVGRPAIWRNEIQNCCFQNTLIRFRVDESRVVPEFALAVFLYYFRTGEFARLSSKTSTVAHLSASRFAKMPFPLPPLALQQAFAEKVAEANQLEKEQTESSQKFEALFQSLLTQAFTGELTATWREQHQAELVGAAEGDRLLQIPRSVKVEELVSEEAIEVQISELHRDRTELLNNLSQEQRRFYELIIQESAYFTPEGLEEKYNLPRNQIQGSLKLFADSGLILSLGLPTGTTKGLGYELVYRNLKPDDDTRLSDGILRNDQELEKERV
uniref:restriction endonuclease subunit S n=1 Tax=Trichocoleus desertorum TaxID=1481672 RepID=UPI0025B5F863|nr:restriction endonuclease subunit S [Trichocoleus desertorum]